MKPVAALVAITLLALGGLLGAGSLAGAALAAAPGHGAEVPPPDAASGPLRLDLDQVAPRVVTASGPGTLTVTGTLTNTGDTPVEDLEVRVQRGNPVSTEGALRDALDGSGSTDSVTPQFVPVPGELAPGGRAPVRFTVPLRGSPQTSLALSSTGVHELLVNVNGVPLDGARARLAAVRMLLPVLSLPPDPASPDEVPDATTGGATPFAMLFPITDTPRRVATVPGEPTMLTDDDLAASFAPNGRLDGVVAALARDAPPGSPVRAATCLAIDPDLVQTADLMRRPEGYQVLGRDGAPPVPGTGGAAAAHWLDQLAAVARSGCVIALPYADADLAALTHGGMGELATTAVSDGRQVLGSVLGAPVASGVTWPVDGVADEATLDAIAQADGSSVILSADGVEQGRTRRTSGVLPIAGGRQPQFTVLTDPLLTRAAEGPDLGGPSGPVGGAPVISATPAGTVAPLSTQDVIGALAFRTAEHPPGSDRADGPLVLAPPHQWAVDGTGASALLGAVDQLLAAGRIVPTGLDGVLATGPPTGAAALPPAYPVQAGGREVPGDAVGTVRGASAEIDDLASAAVPDANVGVRPEQMITPLREGLARAVSSAWRGRPDSAMAAASAMAGRVGDLRATVRVLEPPSPYSLGTSDAPILITLANGLPVTVEVRVEILPSSGLRVAPIEPQQVPPLGRRQVRASAEVTRSGQFTVQATVRTPNGELLGPPSRLRVRSTAYGTITVWLTASAGVLLVVLAVRRVLRRTRGEPGRRAGRAPEGPPEPPPGSQDPPQDPPQAHGPPEEARRRGDPFPDPLAATDRLPVPHPRPRGPRRPPGPPRVPSP